MIFFEYDGRDPRSENRFREILLLILTVVLAIVLLPFTVLLGVFWAVWDLAQAVSARLARPRA
jgi:hypothetical protein